MYAVLANDAFLRYPDPSTPPHIFCDASDYQHHNVIMQEGSAVAYYSRKLNTAQRNYTIGEKDLLSIVETFREYRDILFGCRDIHVYADHHNIMHHKLNNSVFSVCAFSWPTLPLHQRSTESPPMYCRVCLWRGRVHCQRL